MIRNALLKIMSEYPNAIKQPRKPDHYLYKYIDKNAVSNFKKKLPEKYLVNNYFVHSSSGMGKEWSGKGNGKRNPFIMIGNPRVTKTGAATRGFYIAYGLRFKDKEIDLSIGQSDWEIEKVYSDKTLKEKNDILNSYAIFLRSRLNSKDYSKEFKDGDCKGRPGYVIQKTYSLKNLPIEKNLNNDLFLILDLYDKICESGGRPELDDEKNEHIEFDPDNIDFKKEKVLRSVTYRRGQKKFRDNLLKVYDSECVMSGCTEEDVLQAAHILPYTDIETNKIDNGLLLRADLHNLFDLYLISIDPIDFTIKVSKNIKDLDYRKLHGRKLKMPKTKIKNPSKKALEMHFKKFKK